LVTTAISFSLQLSTAIQRRLIWSVVVLSIGGTTLVQAPFLLHLAGTSEWQRLSVLSLGFGIMIASTIILLFRHRNISPFELAWWALTPHISRTRRSVSSFTAERLGTDGHDQDRWNRW
jgi:hypothetical protein